MVDLNDTELDALRETGNVGVGNAATALSKLVSKKVDITIPESQFVKIKDFANIVGGPEIVINCLYVKIVGDIEGEALMFFQEDSTKRFVDILMGQPVGTTDKLDDMALSGFKEMSNIVIGAYLNSMADLLSMKVMPSPPGDSYDMLQSVIDSILANLSKSADDVLYIKTDISIEQEKIDGSMVILFEEESLKKVLAKLKEMYGLQ